MKKLNEKRVLHINTKPKTKVMIELKSMDDVVKLSKINYLSLWEDEEVKIYTIGNFFFKEFKPQKKLEITETEAKPEEKKE